MFFYNMNPLSMLYRLHSHCLGFLIYNTVVIIQISLNLQCYNEVSVYGNVMMRFQCMALQKQPVKRIFFQSIDESISKVLANVLANTVIYSHVPRRVIWAIVTIMISCDKISSRCKYYIKSSKYHLHHLF